MSVPNRAGHTPEGAARVQGDHTSPHDGTYKLQMADPSIPETFHSTTEGAHKHAAWNATIKNLANKGGYKIFEGEKLMGGGFAQPLSDPEAKTYKEKVTSNPYAAPKEAPPSNLAMKVNKPQPPKL